MDSSATEQGDGTRAVLIIDPPVAAHSIILRARYCTGLAVSVKEFSERFPRACDPQRSIELPETLQVFGIQ